MSWKIDFKKTIGVSSIRNLPESIRRLRLDVIEAENFRSSSGVKLEDDPEWKQIRLQVLQRDDYTCSCCGFRYEKYMEVHHLDGIWNDNSLDRLYTLCPICHSCFHIGLAGISGKGSLIILTDPVGQAKLNALIWETITKYKNHAPDAVKAILETLPIKQNLGNEGLIMLANRILKEKQEKKKEARKVSERYILFPAIEKYHLTRLLMSS